MTLPGVCMAVAGISSVFFSLIQKILLGNLASGVLVAILSALITYGLIALTMLGGSKFFGMAGAGVMLISSFANIINFVRNIGLGMVAPSSIFSLLLGLALGAALFAQMFLWDGEEKFTAIAIAGITALLCLINLISCFALLRFLSDRIFLGLLVSRIGSIVTLLSVLDSAVMVFLKGKE